MPDGGQRSIKGEQTRTFQLELAPEGEQRAYSASLSSEAPVERWFGTEVLSHAPEAVNLERASRGLPLLFNHDMDQHLGKVRNVTIEGGRLRGELTFGKRQQAVEIREEIDAGMLGDISIRYSIDEYETKTDEHGHDTVTVTRWTVLEASVVTVPADPNVGVGRSRRDPGNDHQQETRQMPEARKPDEGQDGAGASRVNVAELTAARTKAKKEGAEEARVAERARMAEVDEIFANCRFKGEQFDLLRKQCQQDGTSPDEARKSLLELIDSLPENQASPTASRRTDDEGTRARPARDPFVSAGTTSQEKLVTGLSRAIEFRGNVLSPADMVKERVNEFRNLSLSEMAREWALAHGLEVRGLSRNDMIGRIFLEGRMRAIGLGTTDFTGILANVASKQLLRGWEEAESPYRSYTRKGSLTDFKRSNRTGLSGYSLLQKVKENGEIKHGKTVDRTEYITLDTYALLFAITRQAVINDDLGAFTAAPRALGRSADRTVNKMVVDLLVSASGVGPTLNQDGVALFHTTHNNYDADSGGITVDNLDVGRKKMRRQLDPTNSQPLNIQPSILLVPAALETGANVMVASETDPIGDTNAKGGAKKVNPFYKKLNVVCEPTLDDATNGTTAWYLSANPEMFDTIEVAFLDGNDTPYFEQQNGWSVDGVEMKVRIDAAAAVTDFRGLYRKRGA